MDAKEAVALDLQVRKVLNQATNLNEEIPELDPRWKQEVQFISYSPLPLHTPQGSQQPVIIDDASLEEWRDRVSFIEDDLKWLLCLPHNQFWCQVIFDETLQCFLDSYLRHAPRSFDMWSYIPAEVLDLHKSIHHRVFMVYLRMSTHKESKTSFLSEDTFGEILYSNFLFDIPKIMDICALYGGEHSENKPLLRKMIVNIFSKQPKYYEDLDDTIPTLIETMNNILTKCGLVENPTNSPQKLGEKNSDNYLSKESCRDLVFYILDIGHTVTAFMDTFPLACQSLHRHGFVLTVASFYETVMPYLRKCLSSPDMKPMRLQLRSAKTLLVNVCNMVLRACCIEPVIASKYSISATPHDDLHGYVEDYLHNLMSMLSDKRFISWYDTHYSIEDDLITIQACPAAGLDDTRIQYIVQAVAAAHEAFPTRTRGEARTSDTTGDHIRNGPVPVNTNGEGSDKHANGDVSTVEDSASTHPRQVDEIELDSMVTSVRDLLPELGDGFVIKCLQHFNYEIEKVINSVLEDTLPPALATLDRNMTKEKALQQESKNTTLISTRHSVFDKDEFDVFTHGGKIDLSRVHKGKKRDDMADVMADKSHLTDAVKERISRYDVFGKFERVDEYDDEYDDTYDSHDVGAQDDDSADELTLRRPFTVPRVLGGPPVSEESEEEKDEDVAQPAPSGQKKDNNEPELVWTRQKGTKKGDGKNKGQGKQEDKGPKGQKGNKGGAKGPPDAKTLRDRAFKEKNKGQRANHNRKAGADRKRNKGMGALPTGM